MREGTAIRQFLVRSRAGCEPSPICCAGAELEEVLLGLCEESYSRFGRKREELRA